jgi:hypothetical protein
MRSSPTDGLEDNNINGPDTKTILEEEITHLKAKLTRSERLLKSKDSHICKMDSETILLKKEYSVLGKSHAISLDDSVRTFVDILVVD